jgi:type III restriction enzyme
VGRGNPYNPLSGFPADMPYFCLRVPTGGGKTWLAAKSVALVNTHLLRCEHSVILWLVPSKPIREQTLRRCATACIRITPRCARPGRSR